MSETKAPDALPANVIGVVGVSAASLGAMGPTISIALGVQLTATQAGAAVPLAFLLATVGTLAVAYAFVVFSRRVASTGVAFTYLGATFGKKSGVTAGLLHAGAWLTITTISTGVSSESFSALLTQQGVHISWFPIFIVEMLIGYTACLVGIRPSTRLMLFTELTSILVLAIVALIVIGKGGASGLSLTPFKPSASLKGIGGIGFGLIFSFSAFFGFEAACALGQESKNPRKTVPASVITSVIVGGVFYILLSYAVTIGFGIAHAAAFAADSTPLNTITSRYVSHDMALVVDALVGVSGFGGTMASMNLASRVFYNISRNGLAPKLLGRVHHRFKTPYIGLTLNALVAIGLAVFLGLPAGYTDMIGIIGGTVGICVLATYFAVEAAAIWKFGRESPSAWQRFFRIITPVVGMAIIAFAIYSTIIPQPAFPFNLALPIAAAWLIICIVISVRQTDRGVTPALDVGAIFEEA